MAELVRTNYVKSETMGGYTPRPMFCDGCGCPIDGSDAHFELYIKHDGHSGGYKTCHHICVNSFSECLDQVFSSLYEDSDS